MPVSTDSVREYLLTSDSEFQKLAQQHSQYDSQLELLLGQPYLSKEDLERESTLKKLKLRVKDQMELLVARRARANGNA